MTDDFSGSREYRPTQPFDSNDPSKFGQLIETAKDAFASEIRRFFDYRSDDMRAKLGELVNIEKFAHMGTGSTSKSMETVLNLIQSYGDTPDRFPMIAITSASVREKRLGIGGNLAVLGQREPRITATKLGPFDIQPGWTVQLKTYPQGTDADAQISTFLFEEILFPNIHAATVSDVVTAINSQALYYQASVAPTGYLRLSAGGPAARETLNSIEIMGGTPACLEALGFVVGQSDTYLNYTENPPKKRYSIAGEMVVNLDVVTDSLNTRTELADLVFDFFALYLERQFFQIIGRSYDNPDLDPPEWFHIILKGEFSWAGEYAMPRAGGDQKEQIYSIRGSVPVIIVDFVDRPVNRGESTFVQPEYIQYSDGLPEGDYPGTNYRNT